MSLIHPDRPAFKEYIINPELEAIVKGIRGFAESLGEEMHTLARTDSEDHYDPD